MRRGVSACTHACMHASLPLAESVGLALPVLCPCPKLGPSPALGELPPLTWAAAASGGGSGLVFGGAAWAPLYSLARPGPRLAHKGSASSSVSAPKLPVITSPNTGSEPEAWPRAPAQLLSPAFPLCAPGTTERPDRDTLHPALEACCPERGRPAGCTPSPPAPIPPKGSPDPVAAPLGTPTEPCSPISRLPVPWSLG